MRYVLNTLTNTKLKDNTKVLLRGDFNEDLTTTTHESTDTPKMSWLNMLKKHMRLLNVGTKNTFLPRNHF